MTKDIEARVWVRLGETPTAQDAAAMADLVRTIEDRICLRIGAVRCPDALASIVTDAAVKAWRRRYYEGITSESAGDISTSFVDDILSEYEQEISGYIDVSGMNRKRVRFL